MDAQIFKKKEKQNTKNPVNEKEGELNKTKYLIQKS
jgi:hypothetical protein